LLNFKLVIVDHFYIVNLIQSTCMIGIKNKLSVSGLAICFNLLEDTFMMELKTNPVSIMLRYMLLPMSSV